MNQTFIIICADESKNAGERDYTFALMAELRALEAAGQKITTHLFKIPTENAFAAHKNGLTTDAKNLRPEKNADYKKVPPVPEDISDYLGMEDGPYVVLGVGRSTLDATAALHSQMEEHGYEADCGLVAGAQRRPGHECRRLCRAHDRRRPRTSKPRSCQRRELRRSRFWVDALERRRIATT